MISFSTISCHQNKTNRNSIEKERALQLDSSFAYYDALTASEKKAYGLNVGKLLKKDIYHISYFFNNITKEENYQKDVDNINEMIATTNHTYERELDLLKHKLINSYDQFVSIDRDERHNYIRKKLFEKLENESLTFHQREFLYMNHACAYPRLEDEKDLDKSLDKCNRLSSAFILSQIDQDSLYMVKSMIALSKFYFLHGIEKQSLYLLDNLLNSFTPILSEQDKKRIYQLAYAYYLQKGNLKKVVSFILPDESFNEDYVRLYYLAEDRDKFLSYYYSQTNKISRYGERTKDKLLEANYAIYKCVLEDQIDVALHLSDSLQKMVTDTLHYPLCSNTFPFYVTIPIKYHHNVDTKDFEKLLNYVVAHSFLNRYLTLKADGPYFHQRNITYDWQYGDNSDIVNFLCFRSFLPYLSEYYQILNKKNAVLKIIDKTVALNDSLFVHPFSINTANLIYKINKNNLERTLRLQENNQRINQNKIIIFIVLVFSIIIMTSIVFIFYMRDNKRMNKLYLLLAKQRQQSEEKAIEELKTNNKSELFLSMEKYIQDKKLFLNSDLSLATLCTHFECNRTYISREINKNAQCNFNQWINQMRIQFIMEEINKNGVKPENLNSNFGFSSRSTLYRAFKAYTGKTPIQYYQSVHTHEAQKK